MKDYANNEVEYNGCPSCAFANHEWSIECGIAYEDELFVVSQDWELPIAGFIVVSPKRHIENMSDLSDEEREKAFNLTNEIIKILKKHNVCDRFNVIFEEKSGRHFHIWVMPRHKWMQELVGGITKNIGRIFEYATENLKTKEHFDKIKEISNKLREELIKG